MQSKRKTNGVVGCTFDGHHTMAFSVGEQSFNLDVMAICGEAFFNLNANGKESVVHGLRQKVSDRAAIGRDPETGASATPEEKFAAMKECADRLMAGGPWNAVQTGGAGAQGGLLFRAMKTLYPNAWSDRVTFAAYIAEKAISETARLGMKVTETDVRNSLMRVKKIAKAMDEIRAQTGGPVLEVGGMLQELEGSK